MEKLYTQRIKYSYHPRINFLSRLLTNLLKVKILDPIGLIKVLTIVGVSKWEDILGNAVLTNGSWKMGQRLTFYIVSLSKKTS